MIRRTHEKTRYTRKELHDRAGKIEAKLRRRAAEDHVARNRPQDAIRLVEPDGSHEGCEAGAGGDQGKSK